MNFTANQITLLAALVGVAGGFGVWLLDVIREKVSDYFDKKTVYEWLNKNVSAKQGDYKFRTTKSISNHTNLTKERVEYICSIHPDIREDSGQDDGLWTVRTLDNS